MYLDGLVIRTHPEVLLIKSMGPYLDEFKVKLGLEHHLSDIMAKKVAIIGAGITGLYCVSPRTTRVFCLMFMTKTQD